MHGLKKIKIRGGVFPQMCAEFSCRLSPMLSADDRKIFLQMIAEISIRISVDQRNDQRISAGKKSRLPEPSKRAVMLNLFRHPSIV